LALEVLVAGDLIHPKESIDQSVNRVLNDLTGLSDVYLIRSRLLGMLEGTRWGGCSRLPIIACLRSVIMSSTLLPLLLKQNGTQSKD
jgi:hypothetical protein